MSNRNVSGYVAVNANIKAPVEFDADAAAPSGVVGSLGVSGLTVQELGDDALHQTVLTLTDVAQTVVNGTEYQGTRLYAFPLGRLYVLGVTMNIAQKTTSTIASTLHSGSTGAVSLGTVTASSTTLSSTMVDLMASTAFTSSTTINTAGSAVGGVLAPASFDGHSTAKSVYLNSAFATTADVAADATQTWTGTITITWANLGVSVS
jgi:hypothetical protein